MANRAEPSGLLFAHASMIFDPTTMVPQMDVNLRRSVFIANIHRKPSWARFRGVEVCVRVNEPSMQRRAQLAGYMDQVTDIEIMIALPTGSAKPVPLSSDGIRIYDTDCSGLRTGNTDYRITEVMTDIAPDCYQLSLSKRTT